MAALVLAGAVLNGWTQAVVEWAHGLSSDISFGLPISPIDLAVVAISFLLIFEGSDSGERRVAGAPELAAAAAIALPSGAFAWLAAAAYALFMAGRFPPRARQGLLLLAALAVLQLWNTVFIKWVAVEIGHIDATMAGALLSLFVDGVRQEANVLGVGEHSVVILATCATFSFVFRLTLIVAAGHCLGGAGDRTALLTALLGTMAIATLANVVRLALMASSTPYYEALHSPMGFGLFDLVMVLAATSLLPGAGRRRKP